MSNCSRGCAVVTLKGELDAFDAPELRRTFEATLEGQPAVVVLDLAAVTFLDSTILGAIVGLLRRVRESDAELRTVLPETTARRVFEITALDTALDVWPSRGERDRGYGLASRLRMRTTVPVRRRGPVVEDDLVHHRPHDGEPHAALDGSLA